MQFYARFQDEVVSDPRLIAEHVASARERVSDAFRQLFDVALVQAHEAGLSPRAADLAAKVRFVTIYHLVLEATLGLTTFKFTDPEFSSARDCCPVFVDG